MRVSTITRIWALGLVLGLAAVTSAREVEITLKDGRTVVGELVSENAQAVTIKVSGIETTFARTQIKDGGVVPRLTLAEQFEDKRAEIKPDDWSGRYELARWAFDQKTTEGYNLALAEVESILKTRPDHKEAGTLKDVIIERLKLDPTQKPVNPTPNKPEPPTEAAPEDAKGAPVASAEDINIIRVFEVNLSKKPPPRVTVPNEVIDELFKKYRDDAELEPYLSRTGEKKFRAMSGPEQLGIIFNLKAREFYPEITVRDDPAAIADFKTRVQANYLIRHCGVCHGEGKAKGFYVVTLRPTQESTTYTNYLLATRTVSGGLPLVFKPQPDRSPLMQFGLPRKEAVTAHPDVKGWKPYFNGRSDRNYIDMIDWITHIYTDPTEYPVKFVVPGAAAATPAPTAGAPKIPDATKTNP